MLRRSWAIPALQNDSEVRVAGAEGGRLDLGVADVAGELALDVRDAVVDLGRLALDEHLDRAVGAVPHKAGHGVMAGDLPGGVAEPHALDPSPEDDMSCRLAHAIDD